MYFFSIKSVFASLGLWRRQRRGSERCMLILQCQLLPVYQNILYT